MNLGRIILSLGLKRKKDIGIKRDDSPPFHKRDNKGGHQNQKYPKKQNKTNDRSSIFDSRLPNLYKKHVNSVIYEDQDAQEPGRRIDKGSSSQSKTSTNRKRFHCEPKIEPLVFKLFTKFTETKVTVTLTSPTHTRYEFPIYFREVFSCIRLSTK